MRYVIYKVPVLKELTDLTERTILYINHYGLK